LLLIWLLLLLLFDLGTLLLFVVPVHSLLRYCYCYVVVTLFIPFAFVDLLFIHVLLGFPFHSSFHTFVVVVVTFVVVYLVYYLRCLLLLLPICSFYSDPELYFISFTLCPLLLIVNCCC